MRRRQFAKIVGGTALLGNVSLTGCLGGGSTEYTSWLFDPVIVPELGDMTYEVAYYKPASLPESDDTEANQIINIGGIYGGLATVRQYSSDGIIPDEEIGIQGEDVDSRYEGYDIYQGSSVAVNEDENVAITDADSIDIIQAMVDTHNGEEQPYTQSSEDFRLATQVVGGGDWVYVSEADGTGTLSDAQAVGVSFDFNADRTGAQFRYAYVFPSESTAENRQSEVEREVSGQQLGVSVFGLTSTETELNNVAQNGRSVLVTGSTADDNDEVDSGGDQVERRRLTNGDTIEGTITTSSPSDPIDDDLAEPHYFRGSAGDRVEIDMTSEDFDTYLVLVGPSGDEVAQDDDGGTDLNSSLITRLPQNGEYTIWAGSFSGDATGSYNLSLTFV